MRSKGIDVYERIMDKNEYQLALKDKLFEEVEEVKLSKNKNELIEELADVLEVIEIFPL